MRVLALLLFMFSLSGSLLSQSHRPKIGLTLSGGGAKGLAHIGILKAIDSAGLKIDYITGTSMGSVMGGLYAVGYSGKDIERIAKKIDWVTMFSNKPPIELINMNEKREFSNYAVEVPLERGKAKAKFYSGFIEAEEIWLKFGELFYPVHDVKDFSKFSIPFQCIATDAATGKAVVLKEGEVVKAIRSSMAIPSIFSAVTYNNTKLVDGGVVRNFPVSDVRKMGADYVIGVNLSHGLMTADRLISPIDMIYQIAFYKDAESFEAEKKSCNILIEPILDGFSAASFGASDSIISIGNETGRQFYPYFKKLADSLRTIYPDAIPAQSRLPVSDKVILDAIVIEGGLEFTSFEDFRGKTGLVYGKSYSGKEIANGARKAFGTGNFRRISFFIEPLQPGHVQLRYEVLENLPTYFKAGIHYNSYSDIALITTLATRNLFFNRSKSFAKINWSDNARLLLAHDQAFGQKQRWGALVSFYHERFKFPIYEELKQKYDYRSLYTNIDLKIYRLFKTTSMIGGGLSQEWLKLDPIIAPNLNLVFSNNYWNAYLFFQRNNLDTKIFPHRGSTIDLQAGIIFDQSPSYDFIIADTIPVSADSLFTYHSYQQFKLKAAQYFPLHRRWTVMTQFNAGLNFNYGDSFLNFYSVGGINDYVRNQIPFVGLSGNQVNTNSVVTFLTGIQYEPFTNIFTTIRANIGLVDFIPPSAEEPVNRSFLSGYAISGGYRSAIGPIEISLMYNDQINQFKGYVNLGFTF